eukprot:scaffold129809_cov39-Tisochrysis_lutea.AAC.1
MSALGRTGSLVQWACKEVGCSSLAGADSSGGGRCIGEGQADPSSRAQRLAQPHELAAPLEPSPPAQSRQSELDHPAARRESERIRV